MGEQPNQRPENIRNRFQGQNLEHISKQQLRKQNFENIAWKAVTDTINFCIDEGKIAEAERQAQSAINNWEEEGKTDIISDFKIWLKSKNIDLDKE